MLDDLRKAIVAKDRKVIAVTVSLLILIPALVARFIPCKHKWLDPTCLEPSTCAICGETTGDALGHDWYPATCTEPIACARCGKTLGGALGHTVEEWICVRQATCMTRGLEEGTCTRCGSVEKQFIPLSNHRFGRWTITQDPTCTLEGEKVRICTVCDHEDRQTIEALGHQTGEWVRVGGEEHLCCTACGAILASRDIPVSSHLPSYQDFLDSLDEYTGRRFAIAGRITHIHKDNNLIKVTQKNPKGGKVDYVQVFVFWDENQVVGEVAHIEIPHDTYYANELREKGHFQGICELVGVDDNGHPQFTCTSYSD